MTRGPVGVIGTSEIGQMFFLPRLARRSAGGWRFGKRVMEPAMPFGRNAGGLGDAVVHHPALAPHSRDDALVLKVAVAFGIRADQFAAHLREEPSADDHEPTTS